MATAAAPLPYEVATRPWLARLSTHYGRRVTLGDIPDEEIEARERLGFDYLWPVGVWRTGEAATRIARRQRWLREHWSDGHPRGTAPELVASPFAVAECTVDDDLGGEAGLDRLRRRLADAGVGRILDFVPHHTATGRDPCFPPWRDTVALDYRNPAVREAMACQLLEVAGRCDGVRADMAMLVLDDVFRLTWSER